MLENRIGFYPTYGNTLMASRPAFRSGPRTISRSPITRPAAERAVLRVVDPNQTGRVPNYGEWGRVELTTLTREFFMPRFLERDEAIRREPRAPAYAWDGVAEVRPFGAMEKKIVEGVLNRMTTLPHLPVLRRGRPYESLDKTNLVDHRTGAPLVTLSQVNAGIVRKDLARMGESRAALKKFTTAQLLEICARAGELFLNGSLPLGDQGHKQSAGEYLETLSATSGLPHVMVRRNMAKIHHALTQMRAVLNGLTRGLDLSILDRGYGEQLGTPVSYYPVTQALGLVMPSNSPAVNSLWLPAIPLKIPVIIKPGREEPWTLLRLIQCLHRRGLSGGGVRFLSDRPRGRGGDFKILRSRADFWRQSHDGSLRQ